MVTQVRERAVISPNELTIARLDDALGELAHRELVRTDEALARLRGLAETIDDPVRAARAASIVADTAASYGDASLVGCGQVLDALLDLRLVLTT